MGEYQIIQMGVDQRFMSKIGSCAKLCVISPSVKRTTKFLVFVIFKNLLVAQGGRLIMIQRGWIFDVVCLQCFNVKKVLAS